MELTESGSKYRVVTDQISEDYESDFNLILREGHRLRGLALQCLDGQADKRPTADGLVLKLTVIHDKDPSLFKNPTMDQPHESTSDYQLSPATIS